MKEQAPFDTIITWEKSAEQIAAENTAQILADRFSEQWKNIISELLKEVETAKLASRFKSEYSVI